MDYVGRATESGSTCQNCKSIDLERLTRRNPSVKPLVRQYNNIRFNLRVHEPFNTKYIFYI